MGTIDRLCRERWPHGTSAGHFVGATGESFSLANALGRFNHVLREAEQNVHTHVLGMAEEAAAFATNLGSLASDRDVFLLLDGLDEMDQADHACGLEWIPNPLPPRVRLVCSAGVVHPLTQDSDGVRILLDNREPVLKSIDAAEVAARLGHPRVVLPPLSRLEIGQLMDRLSSLYAKTLDADQRRRLSSFAYAGNPLFMTVVLEELRTFGSFANLEHFIESMPNPEEVPSECMAIALSSVFIHFLTDLYAEREDPILGRVLGFLSISRSGLHAAEICELAGVRTDDGRVAQILRRMRPYLHMRENRYLVRYESLCEAIRSILDPEEHETTLGRFVFKLQQKALGIEFQTHPLSGGLRSAQQRHSTLARLLKKMPLDDRKATDYYYHLSRGTDTDKDALLEELYGDAALLEIAWKMDREAVDRYARSALCGEQWLDTNKFFELDEVVNRTVQRLEDEAHESYAKQDFAQVIRLCEREEVVGLVSRKNGPTETARSNMMLVFVEQKRWAECGRVFAAHRALCVERKAPEDMVKLLVTVILRCIALKHPAQATTYVLELAAIREEPNVDRRLRSLNGKGNQVQRLNAQLNELGRFLIDQKRPADAITCFRLQVSLYLCFDDLLNAALSLANVGIVYYNAEAFAEAVPELIRSVQLWVRLKDLDRMRDPLELAMTAAHRIAHPALDPLLELYGQFWDDAPASDWERATQYVERAVATLETRK
ncbi:MAG: tetratricopeptide repeat protein [Phycisphaerae bacterium]|nr:tetratricopeptide repeat protein [Phycisphaerae bacterium]